MKEIPVFYHPGTYKHNPQYENHKGERMPHLDSPERVLYILQALRECGFANINMTTVNGMPWIEQVHDSRYLKFLQHASNPLNLRQLVPDSEVSLGERRALYVTIFPYSNRCHSSGGEAEIGIYAYDLYTPVMAGTYDRALESASCAVAGAQLLSAGEPIVYSLCRPPGHHATKDKMGGYCYLNNTAIAARLFLEKGIDKVAILDIDVHHGNGTQEIFYDNPKVFYASIHALPQYMYPYFSGYFEETGEGTAKGTKLNIPLPRGIGEDVYQAAIENALRNLRIFNPEYLLVSAGFDTHKEDPFNFFQLSTKYYEKLGKTIIKLGLPVLVIQEGGYNPEILGDCVVSFLKGLIKI